MTAPFTLQRDSQGRLGLWQSENNQPLVIDFGALSFQRRLHQALYHGDLLFKVFHPKGRHLLDPTAGFGQDAFLLAAKGFEVDLYEYHPLVYAVLQDAIVRASQDPKLVSIASRLHLSHRTFDTLSAKRYDAIYLDPMFPEKTKSALPPNSMQWLGQLTCNPISDSALLELACRSCQEYVVLKRPNYAPALLPHFRRHSVVGKSHRFDVYPAL